MADDQIIDGRYRLVHPLAKVTSGGFVYATEHVFTRKPCALKVLDAAVSEKVRKRMRREMEALAAVQGPGVVDFRDGGESDGRMYIALELLEGRTLAALLAAKGKLGIEQVLRLGVDLTEALGRCHERGVVHRDVKPANAFITTAGHLQLLDFGIAKLLGEQAEPLEKLTQENSLVGTPEYMPLEALLMSPDVDGRGDQYAVGVTLYECLAGVVPFEGTYGQVLKKVSSSDARPVEELRPDVPPALAEVLRHALAKDPAGRYESVHRMRDALRAIGAAGDPLLGSSATTGGRRDASTVADSPVAKAHAGLRKRRHPRATYVTLARLRSGEAEHVDGRVEEISESGFQFVGTQPIAEGTGVTVRFALPVSGVIVEARATPRWKRAARGLVAAGFEFESLPDHALAEIRKYVALMAVE